MHELLYILPEKMKKNQLYEGKVGTVRFPNKGVVHVDGEDGTATVKNVLPGQRVRFVASRIRHGAVEGRLLEVLEKAPDELAEPACPHSGACGGCSYQTLPYEEQLRLKSTQVLDLLRGVVPDTENLFEGICPSPRQFGYRNKMEFTFGDEEKGGPLTLGMHRRGSRYDIVSVKNCQIVDADFRTIRTATEEYFRAAGTPCYQRMRHEGYLRHLLVRKAARTGEILVDLVTTTQDLCQTGTGEEPGVAAAGDAAAQTNPAATGAAAADETALLAGWRDRLQALELDGTLVGILHTRNDSLGDVVLDEGTDILYGQDFFCEEILGLTFRITPFSFFQTNSLGAEVLYETAREFIAEPSGDEEQPLREDTEQPPGKDAARVVFDLYSGTGTIAQMLAPAAGRVIGVEIVPEAVEAARENAAANGLINCEFFAGDVLRVLDDLTERPDFIVLDPPRDGVHPKALQKIMAYGVERILYISCKPTSLARDLVPLREGGYRVERLCCVDLFPGTVHTETIVALSKTGG